MNIREAMEREYLDINGLYTSVSKEKWNLEEMIQKEIILLQEGNQDIVKVISETKKVVVRTVLDPRTGEELEPDVARKRRLLDMDRGIYIHPMTSNTMSLQEAIDAGYIRAETKEDEEVTLTKALKETRSFTITGCIDPETNLPIDVATALHKGIIDQANAQYVGSDARGKELRIPISEAIRKQLVIAQTTTMAEDIAPSSDGPRYIQETKKLSIKSVVDPYTNREIPVSEALKQGLIDQSKGLYINKASGTTMLITDAIQKGLVVAEVTSTSMEIERPSDSKITTNRKTVYTLNQVIDPNTGELLTPNEAIARGIIDQERGLYRNPRTGETISLSDAIDRDKVKVTIGRPEEEDEESERVPSIHIDDEEDANKEMALEEIVEETKTFQITSVQDPSTGEMINYHEALEKGIIREDRGVYCNEELHQEMPITEALNAGFIVGQLVSASEKEELFKSAYVATRTNDDIQLQSVINPITGLAISVAQAVRLGLLNQDKTTYYNPATDSTISIEDAIKFGLVNPTK
jgi:dystonin